MGRGRIVSGVIALAALGGVAGGAAAVAASAPPKPRIASATAANRQRAVADAKRLLSGVVPPAGALVQSSGTSTGPHAPFFIGALASAVAYGSWTVPDAPVSVLSFVESHLPPGSSVLSTGGGGPSPVSLSVIRSWPAIKGVLVGRWLELSVTATAGGGTRLYAAAQSQWLVTRPAGERVPAGVREVDVIRIGPGKAPAVVRRVRARAQLRALIALFDSLIVVQPGVINCPGMLPAASVVIEFRSAAGGVLARAVVSAAASAPWPDTIAGWACYPVTFRAFGRPWPELAGGVIRPMQRLLHVKLAATLKP